MNSTPPTPDDFSNLDSYKLVSALPEKEFDGITELAAALFEIPFSTISVVLDDTHILKSQYGFTDLTLAAKNIFVEHTLKNKESYLIVEDFSKDPRFDQQSNIIGRSTIVFFAGIQLIDCSGTVYGVLAIYDSKPRAFTSGQLKSLELLSNQLQQLFELHNKRIQLDNSEEKYKAMIENSASPFFYSDPAGFILDANKAACDLFGYSREEFKNLPRKYMLDENAIAKAKISERQSKGFAIAELIGIKKNGERFPVEVTSSLFTYKNGEQRATSIIIDITERKKLERENFMFSNNTEELFIMLDINFDIISVNKQFQEVYALYFNAHIEIGHSIIEYLDPEKKWDQIEIYHNVLKGQNQESEFYLTNNEKAQYFLVKYKPIRNLFNEIEGISITAIDITKRKETEKLLVAREQQLTLIYNSVNDIIFLVDNEGNNKFKYVSVNNSFYRLTGYHEEYVVGHYLEEVLPDPIINLVIAKFNEAIATKKDVYWERETQYPSGLKSTFGSFTPIFDSKGNCTQIIGSVKDVTEAKKAERERNKISNELYKIMHSSLDVICTIDEYGNFINVSGASEKIWGYKPEEIIGKPFINLVYEEDRERTLAQSDALIAGYTTTNFENRYIHKNGSIVPIVWSIKWDPSDRIIYCTAKDATEIKEFENTLIASEKKYKYLFENNPTPMFIWDFETLKFVDCNDEALNLYGYTKDEFLRLDLLTIRPEADRELASEFIETNENKGNLDKLITAHQKKDGTIIQVEINAHLMTYNSRKSSLVLITDITEKLKIEAEIIKSEQRYTNLFHLSPQPKFVCDSKDLLILDVNEAAIQHYGYSREEFQKMTFTKIIIGNGPQEFKMSNTSNNTNWEIIQNQIYKHQKKNGEIIDVEVKSRTINFKDTQAEVILINDITATLKHLKSIELQNETLKEIAWMQSHVVRAPLARIMGMVNLMSDKTCGIDEKMELLPYVFDSANELDGIIKDIVKKSSMVNKMNT